MSFNTLGLDTRLEKSVALLGFEQATPIQAATIPVALTGQDILGSAETGTGKTAAYLIPAIQKLLEQNSSAGQNAPHALRVLVLVPTRELALQVNEQAVALCKHTDLRVAPIYGGVGMVNQEQALKRRTDIIIATPGRLQDHMARGHVNFKDLQILVLDEGDRMLDVGFLPAIRRIAKELPRERQTMLFSATISAEVMSLASEMTRKPVRIAVEKTVTPQAISHTLFVVSEHQKVDALHQLLADEAMDSVLVFTRTKHRADKIVKHLKKANIRADVIHGNRSQNQRVAALEAFRRGKARVLVATDIAARGIDVEGVSHVVNYDVPMQAEDYVHRIGRTGRAEATGSAYTLVTPLDEPMVKKIERAVNQKLPRRRLEGIDPNASMFQQPDAEAIRLYVESQRRQQTNARVSR